MGASAAAVLAVVATTAVLAGGGDSARDPGPGPADRSTPSTPTSPWRTEHWRDLRVEVPADWGYGGAPMPSEGGAVACYPEAMLSPDGEPLEGASASTLGWVGRPLPLTDVCAAVPDGRPAVAAPYVWLGADVEPGTVDLGGGYVQTTVEVNGSLLTVATDDPALAERILDSAGGGETCLSDTEPSAELIRVDADAGPPTALTLCAYRQPGSTGVADLVYAVRQEQPVVDDYLAGLSTAPERDQCPSIDYTETEWLLVALEDAQGRLVRQDVVHLGACPSVDVAATTLSSDLGTVPTTPVVDRLTRTAGLPAVLATLIGPQG